MNPSANILLASRGKVDRDSDLEALLAEDAFETNDMRKMRHLLAPGWWQKDDRGRRGEVAGEAEGADNNAAMTTLSIKFDCHLDKTKLARELKVFNNRMSSSLANSVSTVDFGRSNPQSTCPSRCLTVVYGDVSFGGLGRGGGKGGVDVKSSIHFSAATNALTLYLADPSEIKPTPLVMTPKPPSMPRSSRLSSTDADLKSPRLSSTDAESPRLSLTDSDLKSPTLPSTEESSILFAGFGIKEEEVVQLLQKCVKENLTKKTKKTREGLNHKVWT